MLSREISRAIAFFNELRNRCASKPPTIARDHSAILSTAWRQCGTTKGH